MMGSVMVDVYRHNQLNRAHGLADGALVPMFPPGMGGREGGENNDNDRGVAGKRRDPTINYRLPPPPRRTDILSCMQFVLHAGQLGVLFLNNFALAEQWQNIEQLNFIIFRGEREFLT
jgi:hypothetical protein